MGETVNLRLDTSPNDFLGLGLSDKKSTLKLRVTFRLVSDEVAAGQEEGSEKSCAVANSSEECASAGDPSGTTQELPEGW